MMSYVNLTLGGVMETTRLSSKGQIILPKSIRATHAWGPGVEFMVEDTAEGVLLRPLKPFTPASLDEVVGCTGYSGPARTVEEMDAAIAQGVGAARDRRA
jgi:AbrB family looped-hinge helix DNA binding protein